MNRAATARMTRAWEEIRALIGWWFGALEDLYRRAAGRVVPRLVTRLVARVSDSELSIHLGRDPDAPELLGSDADEPGLLSDQRNQANAIRARYGERILMILPEREVLRYELRLPETLDRHVDEAVALHLEQELPISRDRVCVEYERVQDKNHPGRLAIGIHVARRDRIERHHAHAEALGFHVARIGVQDRTGRVVGNFQPGRVVTVRPRWSSSDRRLVVATAVLALLSLAAGLGQWAYDHTLIRDETARLQLRATAATQSLQQLQDATARMEALVRVMERPDAADVLEALTASVPADAWAYDVELHAPASHAGTVSMQGFAVQANELESALQHFGLLSELETTATRGGGGPSDRERFEIKAALAGPSEARVRMLSHPGANQGRSP